MQPFLYEAFNGEIAVESGEPAAMFHTIWYGAQQSCQTSLTPVHYSLDTLRAKQDLRARDKSPENVDQWLLESENIAHAISALEKLSPQAKQKHSPAPGSRRYPILVSG